jgi:hypothetical protein
MALSQPGLLGLVFIMKFVDSLLFIPETSLAHAFNMAFEIISKLKSHIRQLGFFKAPCMIPTYKIKL